MVSRVWPYSDKKLFEIIEYLKKDGTSSSFFILFAKRRRAWDKILGNI